MRGRKPKPTNLYLVGGGSSGTGQGGPSHAAPKPPTCPAHLSPTAKTEWRRLAADLHAKGVLGQHDRAVLAAYCQAYGRWVEAEKKIAATPMLIKLPSGYIQPSPWLGIANKAQEIMLRYAAELGLSPVSRGRVTIRKPSSNKWRPADEYLGPRG